MRKKFSRMRFSRFFEKNLLEHKTELMVSRSFETSREILENFEIALKRYAGRYNLISGIVATNECRRPIPGNCAARRGAPGLSGGSGILPRKRWFFGNPDENTAKTIHKFSRNSVLQMALSETAASVRRMTLRYLVKTYFPFTRHVEKAIALWSARQY